MQSVQTRRENGSTRGVRIFRFAMALAASIAASGCADGSPTSPSAAMPRDISAARTTGGFSFTTIAPVGARSSVAWGINAGGDIVGVYVDASRVQHGFVLRDGVFTTIDYPGADGTDARGIGPNGEIVGNYWSNWESGVASHAYRLSRQGDFTAVSYPGHDYTIAQRVLPDGTILGCRHDNNTTTTMRGISMGKSGNHEIAAFASMHNGATPDLRRIVGLYMNTTAGRGEGYLIEDGVFTPLLVPGSNFTAAWDMNAVGDVAGVYRNSAGLHGFVLTADGYTSVDAPGAVTTRAFGINARGDVVGSFVQGGKTYGFLARATRSR